MKHLLLPLPPLHRVQAEVASSPAQRIVLVTGRRCGKTFLAAWMSVVAANSGKRVVYAAPIIPQTTAYWDVLMKWLKPAIDSGLIYVNVTKHLIRFNTSGGTILAKTANDPDHLRGEFADLLFLDEFAYMNPLVWSMVCQPMLLDTNGRAVFISTANFRNHFYLLAQQAQENTDGSWAYFNAPSAANPFLKAEALAQLVKDMSPTAYRQEIMAEFVEGLGRVFHLSPNLFYPAPMDYSPHKGHRAAVGMDWGLTYDHTAVSVGCATCKQELMLGRLQGGSYPIQIAEIAQWLTRFKNAGMSLDISAEENSMGRANIDEMRKAGWPVQPVLMTNQLKAELVQDLRLVFEQASWKWVQDVNGWSELEAFEGKAGKGGMVFYGTPYPGHDDTVIARLLMLKKSKMGNISFVS